MRGALEGKYGRVAQPSIVRSSGSAGLPWGGGWGPFGGHIIIGLIQGGRLRDPQGLIPIRIFNKQIIGLGQAT